MQGYIWLPTLVMKISLSPLLSWAIAATLMPSAFAASSNPLLFDVDFDSPGDTAGSPAVNGSAPNSSGVFEHPSWQMFGTTQVIPSYGNLTSQPVRFVPASTGSRYSQMVFQTSSFFNVSGQVMPAGIEFGFDLLLQNLSGIAGSPATDGSVDRFSMLIDAPSAHSIAFNGVNQIYFNASSSSSPLVGSYLEGIAQHYTVTNYFADNRIEIRQDGNLLYSGIFHIPFPAYPTSPTSISSYRLNLADSGNFAGTPTALIDNVTIRFVPEPCAPLLVTLAAAASLARRRRREQPVGCG